MLLGSALPFYGKQRKDVINKILKNKYSFKHRRWRQVSPEAKQFVSDLLVLDPDKRADAERALGSAWLNLDAKSTASRTPRAEEEEMAKASMLRYAGYPKLKKMVSRHKKTRGGKSKELFEKTKLTQ